jgi:hypothetical protein
MAYSTASAQEKRRVVAWRSSVGGEQGVGEWKRGVSVGGCRAVVVVRVVVLRVALASVVMRMVVLMVMVVGVL